jgi:hypothetical protein
MEDSHLSQMVSWLDEEHRKDKAELLRLQQRVESQEAEMEVQSQHLKTLEAQQSSLQSSLAYIQAEQALEQFKSEVVLLVNKAEERRQQEGREAERVRQIERESQVRILNELKKEVERFRPIEDNIATLRAEARRLGEAVQKIQRTIDDLKQEQTRILENVQLRDQDRQRQVAGWGQAIEAQRKEVEECRARTELYADQHERNRKAFEAFQELKERLEREQHQVAELQRLSEERQGARVEEWREEEEKLRQAQQSRWEQKWAEHMRQTEGQEKLLAQLHEQTKEQGRLVAALVQAQEELAQLQITTIGEWQARFEELVTE